MGDLSTGAARLRVALLVMVVLAFLGLTMSYQVDSNATASLPKEVSQPLKK